MNDQEKEIVRLRRQLAQAQAAIHAAYIEGWEEREEYGDVGTRQGEALMDRDWQSSKAPKAAKAAKKEATDGTTPRH